MRLKDKVVIVTGSTMGIGKAIAKRCITEGASVVINGLEQDLGESVVKELGSGKSALHIEDLTKDGAPGRLVNLAVERFGKLDAIVNNAAAVISSNIQTTDLLLFRKVLEVNTLAPFALIREGVPHLTKTGGCVLNIGSVNAWSGEPNLLAYSVSKGALMTMTRNLGDTLHRENGIRVNQINPGWVLTEKEIERKREHGLPDDWFTKIPDEFAPAGRILHPEEIAAAAVYWLSDESGPVSGQTVELEQHPFIGRNPPKDIDTMLRKK
jgi:NAD(P)-dependent dehydrogenase (short-subunit alcohol dehydrogenase family)